MNTFSWVEVLSSFSLSRNIEKFISLIESIHTYIYACARACVLVTNSLMISVRFKNLVIFDTIILKTCFCERLSSIRDLYAIVCRSGSAINNFIMSPLSRMTYQLVQYTVRVSYSTDASRAPKDGVKDQATARVSALTMSKRDRFRLMLRDYGGTLLVFHIIISLISLGACYMVVIRLVNCILHARRFRSVFFRHLMEFLREEMDSKCLEVDF